MYKLLYILLSLSVYGDSSERIKQLPPWQEGYLDIHQIATGRGNATFMILPDSTTILIDAGHINNNRTTMPAFPNTSKTPGEWITIYINHFIKHFDKRELDYVLLSHFHGDHIGGIADVARGINIKKIVDRGYPNYDYPSKEILNSSPIFKRYKDFLNDNRSIAKEQFIVGSRSQFKLNHNEEKYDMFWIQNIYANGNIWTGHNSEVKQIFPDIEELKINDYPNENICSCVIKMTYGNFNYYIGGDILGVISPRKPRWWDVETSLSEIIKSVDVAVANHHAYSDAMSDSFMKSLSPKITIIPTWDKFHPHEQTLKRISNYNNKIYVTGIVKNRKLNKETYKIDGVGHIVVRVYKGGNKFTIYTLNSSSTRYDIINETKNIKSN